MLIFCVGFHLLRCLSAASVHVGHHLGALQPAKSRTKLHNPVGEGARKCRVGFIHTRAVLRAGFKLEVPVTHRLMITCLLLERIHSLFSIDVCHCAGIQLLLDALPYKV